jgi:hypothetical protein
MSQMCPLNTGLTVYEMHYEGKLNLRSHNTTYCLIEVAIKAGYEKNV